MARQISVYLLGDSESLERAFKRSSAQAEVFGRDMSRVERGLAAGSGAFKGLGRSVAFASTSFLAFAGVGEALHSVIDAGTQAAVTQRSLAAQLKSSGLAYKDYRDQIEQTTLRLSDQTGFTRDQLTQAFTTVLRGTNNVTKAQKDLSVVADIAAGRNKTLAEAAIAVGKAAAGSTTSLKRLGIELPKGTTGVEGIAIAAKRFAGQAHAADTAQKAFHSALYNTEEIIGTALLPTVNKYLNKLTDWLNKMNESGRLQRDVNQTLKTAQQVIQGIHTALGPLIGAFRDFRTAVGGTRNAVVVLTGAFVAFKALRLATSIAGIVTQISRVGAQSTVAAGEVEGLQGSLAGLVAGGPYVIPVVLAVSGGYGLSKYLGWAAKSLPGGSSAGTGPDNTPKGYDPNDPSTWSAANLTNALQQGTGYGQTPPTAAWVRTHHDAAVRLARQRMGLSVAAAAATAATATRTGAPRSRDQLTREQQLALGLSGTPTLGALHAQETFDQQQLAAIKRRYSRGIISAKDFTAETVKYRDDLAQQQNAVQSMLKSAAGSSTKTAKSIQAASDAAKQEAVAWADFAIERANATKPLQDDLAAEKAKLRLLEQQAGTAKQTEAQAQLIWETQQAITDLNKKIAGEAKTQARDYFDARAYTRRIDAGLGLSVSQTRTLEARVASLGAGHSAPAGRSVAFSTTTINGGVHLHGVQNVQQLENELHKRAAARPQVRRGAR